MKYEFTEEELEIARGTDLVDFLSSYHYTVRRVGTTYSMEEMDSLRIYNRTTWFRNSDGTGGSPIDFLVRIEGKSFKDAVKELLLFNGNVVSLESRSMLNQGKQKSRNEDRVPKLPEANKTMFRLFAYLMQTRKLSQETVQMLVDQKLIYESKDKHNVVFLSKDRDGAIRHASMRGTSTMPSFKGDVMGSNKQYGFNLINAESDILVVTEAAIDLLSYYELSNRQNYNYLALGMCDDKPLEQFIKDHPHIKHLKLGLDADVAGGMATEKFIKKYSSREFQNRGITVEDIRIVDRFQQKGCKDWNDFLKNVKEVKKKKVKAR